MGAKADDPIPEGMIRVLTDKGKIKDVSDYYAKSPDGRKALAEMKYQPYEQVIPKALKAERPPLIDPEKERLKKDNEALLKRLEALEAEKGKMPIADFLKNPSATPPVETAPVTPPDVPARRGPGRPANAPASPQPTI